MTVTVVATTRNGNETEKTVCNWFLLRGSGPRTMGSRYHCWGKRNSQLIIGTPVLYIGTLQGKFHGSIGPNTNRSPIRGGAIHTWECALAPPELVKITRNILLYVTLHPLNISLCTLIQNSLTSYSIYFTTCFQVVSTLCFCNTTTQSNNQVYHAIKTYYFY
jgi:hypothetical protein